MKLTTTQKVGYLCQIREERECEALALHEHIKRLTERRDSLQREAERIKEYVKTCMELQGIERLDTLHHKLWLQNNPPSAELAEGVEIPKDYMRVKVEFDRKKAIDDYKEAIKGGAMDFVKDLAAKGIKITQGRHLRIK